MVKHLLNGVLDDEVLVECQLRVHRLRYKHWQHSDDDHDDHDDHHDDDGGGGDDVDYGDDTEDRPCSKQCDC